MILFFIITSFGILNIERGLFGGPKIIQEDTVIITVNGYAFYAIAPVANVFVLSMNYLVRYKCGV